MKPLSETDNGGLITIAMDALEMAHNEAVLGSKEEAVFQSGMDALKELETRVSL